jgi:three-Cys-motif partner protein
MRDSHEEYWASYDGLQRAKHSILRKYLGGWFPILTSWSGRVLYIDCHAGRGRHETGEEGSPIIALNCLLEHPLRDRILANAEVSFLFFENEERNAEALQGEIDALGRLPNRVECELVCGDYQEQLLEILSSIEREGHKLRPTFAFIDPFGFSISMDLLNRLLSFSNCELFINLMYRYIDMAIHDPARKEHMDSLFGTSEWRRLQKHNIPDSDERLSQTVELFGDQINARYVTHMTMRGEKKQVKYLLVHVANHQKARELMKEAIWSVFPDGSFTAYERDNPDQLVLLGPNPDLRPLEKVIWEKFCGRKVRMEEIYNAVLHTLYLPKHIHKILRDYRNSKIVSATGYGDRFGFNRNPLFEFPDKRP